MPWNRILEGVKFYTSSNRYYHTYSDWGLILESDSIGFPDVSGVIDGWDGMYGRSFTDFRKKYGRRKLVFNLGKAKVDSRWPTLVSTITGTIHGKKCQIIRDCESAVYYIGRCNVRSYVSKLGIGKIQIEVDAEPFKIARNSATETLNAATLKTSSVSFTSQTDFDATATVSVTFSSSPGDIRIETNNSDIRISDVGIGEVRISGTNMSIERHYGSSTEYLLSDCTTLTRFPVVVPGYNSLWLYPRNLPITSAYVQYSPRFI